MNTERLYRTPSPTPYTKDAFHEHVVEGKPEAVNTTATGTKAAAHYTRNLDPGGTATIDLRLAFRGRNRAATGKYLSLRGREAARFRLL
jgi:hypothetical protein